MKSYSKNYLKSDLLIKNFSILILTLLFTILPLDGSILSDLRIKGFSVHHILIISLMFLFTIRILLKKNFFFTNLKSKKILSCLIILILLYPIFKLNNYSSYLFYCSIFIIFYLLQFQKITLKIIEKCLFSFCIVPVLLVGCFYLGFWDIKDDGNFGTLKFNVNHLSSILTSYILISYYFLLNSKKLQTKSLWIISIIFSIPIIVLMGSRSYLMFLIIALVSILVINFIKEKKFSTILFHFLLVFILIFISFSKLHNFYAELYYSRITSDIEKFNLTQQFEKILPRKNIDLNLDKKKKMDDAHNSETLEALKDFNYGRNRVADRWLDLLISRELEIYGSKDLRLLLIYNAYKAFKEEYLFGYGIGILENKTFMSKKMGIDPLNKHGIQGKPISTHNGIMSYLLIGGIFLLAIIISFFCYLIYAVIKNNSLYTNKNLVIFFISLSFLSFQILLGSIYSKFGWILFGLIVSFLLNNKESN